MEFAGEWRTATSLGTTPAGGSDIAASSDDLCLAVLVRQWVTLSETMERQARARGTAPPARPVWMPTAMDLADHDHADAVPRRHRRSQHQLDLWLEALIHEDATSSGSAHPLMARLKTSSLQVAAYGTTIISDDVKALCHEFVDLSSALHPATGKHRAPHEHRGHPVISTATLAMLARAAWPPSRPRTVRE